MHNQCLQLTVPVNRSSYYLTPRAKYNVPLWRGADTGLWNIIEILFLFFFSRKHPSEIWPTAKVRDHSVGSTSHRYRWTLFFVKTARFWYWVFELSERAEPYELATARFANAEWRKRVCNTPYFKRFLCACNAPNFTVRSVFCFATEFDTANNWIFHSALDDCRLTTRACDVRVRSRVTRAHRDVAASVGFQPTNVFYFSIFLSDLTTALATANRFERAATRKSPSCTRCRNFSGT